MHTHFLFAVLAIAAPDRPAPPPPEARPVRGQVQGQWEITAALYGGNPHGMLKHAPVTFIFDRDTMTIRKPKLEDNVYSYSLDTTTTPMLVEITAKKIAGKDAKGRPVLGILRVDGDVLTICITAAGQPGRPTEFKSAPGTQIMLWQMKRIR